VEYVPFPPLYQSLQSPPMLPPPYSPECFKFLSLSLVFYLLFFPFDFPFESLVFRDPIVILPTPAERPHGLRFIPIALRAPFFLFSILTPFFLLFSLFAIFKTHVPTPRLSFFALPLYLPSRLTPSTFPFFMNCDFDGRSGCDSPQSYPRF